MADPFEDRMMKTLEDYLAKRVIPSAEGLIQDAPVRNPATGFDHYLLFYFEGTFVKEVLTTDDGYPLANTYRANLQARLEDSLIFKRNPRLRFTPLPEEGRFQIRWA